MYIVPSLDYLKQKEQRTTAIEVKNMIENTIPYKQHIEDNEYRYTQEDGSGIYAPFFTLRTKYTVRLLLLVMSW